MKKLRKRANWFRAKWWQKIMCYLGLHKYEYWSLMVLPGPPEGTKGWCKICGEYWKT